MIATKGEVGNHILEAVSEGDVFGTEDTEIASGWL